MTGPSRLRIALVLGTPGTVPGGMEKHTSDLAAGLARLGHEVHVLAHRSFASILPATVHLHEIPMSASRNNPWLIYRVRRTLASIAPDICHAQGNKAAKLIARYRKPGVPRIGTVHGIKSSHRSFAALDGVITINQRMQDSLRHRQTRLIYSGVPTLAIPPKSKLSPLTALPTSQPLILAIGRLEPVKAFDLLIRAWACVDTPGHLVIIGDGSQRSVLQALIRDLDQTDRVTLAGFRNDARDWLAYADLCVISSVREGFSYVLIEALLAGCPILSTPVGGAQEFLPADNLTNGHSVDAMSRLLRQHLTDLASLKQGQSSARARAQQELTLDAMLAQTQQFYRALIHNAQGV
ncbi:glycosyltransferase [Marinobacter caseinilyticus]|uniref:glycosyltransferase n=1 Tax=Marinobacter caseinilyticus TaxID=2692195 RepID=UPI001407F608|nr:glycosyltransferase [Marinobacter caseinilyticus]